MDNSNYFKGYSGLVINYMSIFVYKGKNSIKFISQFLCG